MLRVRLLRTETPQVTVKELPQGVSTYAVNLASSNTPFTPDALAAAAKVVGTRTYVSETVVDEQRWYRLRAGPFVNETAARQALANSRGEFPKAWVAISDDDTLNGSGMPTGVATVRLDRAADQCVDDAGRDQADPGAGEGRVPPQGLRDGDPAADAGDAATGVSATGGGAGDAGAGARTQRPGRARQGRVRRLPATLPEGDGTTRVRKRLQALAWASRPGRSGAAGRTRTNRRGGCTVAFRRSTAGTRAASRAVSPSAT